MNDFYSQDSGGTMGSPLVVVLAEIRVTEVETIALETYNDPPNTHRHYVDDGIGDYRDKPHADGFHTFINSLSEDLYYTIQHPDEEGNQTYVDIHIHPDKSTSVHRKPTHTNLYIRYNSCAPPSTKDSVIRSLTRRAYNLCSPQHLQKELDTVYNISLQNGHPPARTTRIMDEIRRKFEHPNRLSSRQFNRQLKATLPSLTTSLPYHPTLSKDLKKILTSHDIQVTNSSGTTLRNMLTKTKTTPPPPMTQNVIYEIPCNDCPGDYDGQTKRPILKRTKEHEADCRLRQADAKCGPAYHARTTGHTLAWDRTTILTTTKHASQLDLTEHAAIKMRDPIINRTNSVPTCSSQWDPVLPKIVKSFTPRSAGIILPLI